METATDKYIGVSGSYSWHLLFFAKLIIYHEIEGKKKRKSHLTTKNIMRWGQSVKVTSPANTRAFHETRKRETGKPPT